MSSDRRSLTQEELSNVLRQLDDVLSEAERLRREVSRQLAQHRSDQQQFPARAKKRATRKSR
jgi:hypothetical protein